LRCSSSNIVFTDFFALASFAEVGFICGKSQKMVATKTVAKPEVGASGRLAFMSSTLFIVCSNTESAGLQAECAIEMRHRPVIGGLRHQVGIADLAC
jgi:hypothetical protein